MAKELNFETFFEAYGAEFAEYLSRVSTYAVSDAEHKKLTEENNELYRLYPKVRQVIDYDNPCGLSEQECAALIQVLSNRNRLIELKEEIHYQDARISS